MLPHHVLMTKEPKAPVLPEAHGWIVELLIEETTGPVLVNQ
jgi:hypothetical protein